MSTIVQMKEDGTVEYVVEPLTIRDYFAMHVAAEVINHSVDYRQAAQRAYQIADQMIKVRSEDTK